MTAPAELLPWDTAFFGVRIARTGSAQLAQCGTDELLSWCAAERIQLLYLLADPTPSSIGTAEQCGFGLMDVRLELVAPSRTLLNDPRADPAGCRPLQPADLEALRAIARDAHRDSRFFADRRIPTGRAEELFVRWLERDSALGDQGWVGVADVGDGPAGYLTAALDGQGGGRIGLLAVAEGARGGGLGRALLQGAGRWFDSRGVGDVRVVTQGRNVAAQRLYQQAGFRTEAVHLWYHKWFTS